jgi:allantoicase
LGDEKADVISTPGASGTSNRSFHATGVAEQWQSPEREESQGPFTQEQFEKALRKASRPVKRVTSMVAPDGIFNQVRL